ncbi:MAG: DUF4085 family protein [Firmicutes bacterium]|nr:DUF4085 family protein [Bacillota bacterium]
MKYYTKDWYQLMQGLHYVSGMKVVPDKEYTDEEIQTFYDADLAEELEHDRKFHEEKGTAFDPEETVRCFEDFYQGIKTYALNRYPGWARETLDPRLIALNRIPQTPYCRLKELEDTSKAEFDKINAAAQAVLELQDIPSEIKAAFHFHDADVLALRRKGKGVHLYLGCGEAWPAGEYLYQKVIFQNVCFIDREKGLIFRKKRNENGFWESKNIYLYDELYRTEYGYEVHMLLWSVKGLRYLTIGCEDILFEDNVMPDF